MVMSSVDLRNPDIPGKLDDPAHRKHWSHDHRQCQAPPGSQGPGCASV